MFQGAQTGPLQQTLMFLNRATDLALLAVQIAQHQPDFERGRVNLRSLLELIDREIDLLRHEMVETEDEMGRLPRPAAIEQLAVTQLVALPRLANRQA